MTDLIKSLLDKVGGRSGGFTVKGVLIRLGISVTASLAASMIYSTFIKSDDASQVVVDPTVPTISLVPQTLPTTSDVTTSTVLATTSSSSTISSTSAVPSSTTSILVPATTLQLPSQGFVSPIAATPKDGLHPLVEQLHAIDWSKFTGGICPVFVSVVLRDEIRLFKWSSDRWLDFSDLLEIDGVGAPLRVTSFDITNDGNVDFIFQFEDPRSTGGRLGAVFSQKNCAWHWMDVVDGNTITTLVPYLNHDTAFLAMVDPSTGQSLFVEYDPVLDRLEVIR